LAAGDNRKALAEFKASLQSYPNRFRTLAGAAAAARAAGFVAVAKRYDRALLALVKAGDGDRPEVSEAQAYLTRN
jgi:hypothetical protein